MIKEYIMFFLKLMHSLLISTLTDNLFLYLTFLKFLISVLVLRPKKSLKNSSSFLILSMLKVHYTFVYLFSML